MAKRYRPLGGFVALVASAAYAGIPTSEPMVCPVGGEKFTITGTASCSQFGLTQDFYMRRPSSCDFVTRLPQCPDNKLPMYKEFSKDEVALLKDYVQSEEYKAAAGRSRFYLAKKVDDHLVAKGSERAMGFNYLLGGLQFDRENTETDAEYRAWFVAAGEAEITAAAEPADIPYVRLLMAYAKLQGGQFEESSALVQAVKTDATVKDDNKLVKSYVARLEECLAAKDPSKCPSTDMVVPQEKRG